MLSVVSSLLHAASGVRVSTDPELNNVAELLSDIVISELKLILSFCPKSAGGTVNLSLSSFVDLLSGNQDSLHRFVRRFVAVDSLHQDAAAASDHIIGNCGYSVSGYSRSGQIRQVLEQSAWTSDHIEDLLNRPDGTLKVARSIRADIFTRKMDSKAYELYCQAKRVSFYRPEARNGEGEKPNKTAKTGSRINDATKLLLTALSVDEGCILPICAEILAYFAVETVNVVVDLILMLRADRKYGTFTRYSVLRGLDDEALNGVMKAVSAVFTSPISCDEIFNVCRMFCMKPNLPSNAPTKDRKPLILYL